MTGRELIFWILANRLEDEDIFADGSIAGFLTIDKYAAATGVGPATVSARIQLGYLQHIKIGDTYYIPHATTTKQEEKAV